MPELKCTVQTCMHNKDFYCALDKIQVGGSSAKNAEETCCDSFEERKGSAQNSYGNSAGQTASACSSLKAMSLSLEIKIRKAWNKKYSMLF